MTRGARIQTRRLTLRSWRTADVERFQSACNTPEVMRWLGGVQTKKQLRQDVAYFMTMERTEGFTFWVVERRRDKAFLGFVGLIRVEEEDCPFAGAVEIGWRLRKSVWRRGYLLLLSAAVTAAGGSFMSAVGARRSAARLLTFAALAVAGIVATAAVIPPASIRSRRLTPFRPATDIPSSSVH